MTMAAPQDRVDQALGDPVWRGVGFRLMTRHGHGRDRAQSMLRAANQFLVVMDETGLALNPPYLVDVAWHEAILDTKGYASFCDCTFGRFLHHVPPVEPAQEGTPEKRAKGVLATIKVAGRYFRDLEPTIWNDQEAPWMARPYLVNRTVLL
jgi:hypothetical protein